MSSIAVHATGLGKIYKIGRQRERFPTLRDSLVRAAMAPLQRLRGRGRGEPEANTIWALKDVTLDITTGEAVGIIGRNGAGKSTLLKILTRITSPTEGYAEMHGRAGALLEVGTGFHPELTGRENVYLNGAILGMRRAEINRKFDEIVAFAEIEKFLDTPVKRYSSGMYVRLAFAVAAHLEPEILLVDEVLAVGDAGFQQKCLGKMRNVAGEGRTVLFVSHNLPAVRRLCPRAVLIERGHLTMSGASDAVIDRYLEGVTTQSSPLVTLPPGEPDAPGEGICLRFLSADRAPKAHFFLGEKWSTVLEFAMRSPAQQVMGAVGLSTSDSVPIITYWSRPQDLKAGRYRVEFPCDLRLAHSDVQITVGLSSLDRTFYYIQSAGAVSIGEIALDEQPVRASGTGFLSSLERPTIWAVDDDLDDEIANSTQEARKEGTWSGR